METNTSRVQIIEMNCDSAGLPRRDLGQSGFDPDLFPRKVFLVVDSNGVSRLLCEFFNRSNNTCSVRQGAIDSHQTADTLPILACGLSL